MIKTSGEIMKQFANTAPTAEELVDAVEKNMTSSKVPEDYMYYAQNEFKRFMGYVEPDYLRVAGLYASAESSARSKPYNHFLVKKADYVAERLKWYTEDGKPDSKRAERAIRSACKKQAPNGLCYMYTLSNKDKCLTDKGESRVFMSGRRYQQLQDEFDNRKVPKRNLESRLEVSNNDGTSDFETVRSWVKEMANIYGFYGYKEGAVVWVTNALLRRLSLEDIDCYFNQITSDFYYRQLKKTLSCPHINDIFDLFNKYDKIQAFLSDKRRHA